MVKHMPSPRGHDNSKDSPAMLRALLNNLVLKPRLRQAAKKAGLHPVTLFNYLRRSRDGDPKYVISWMGRTAAFHIHADAARKLSIVALDASARDLAINGHDEPRYHDGEPVYKRDPKLVAEALDPDLWETLYAPRPITDTFERDEDGALIQETITHPPNPALLVKMLASLAPDLYGERSEISITHSGHVWIEGDASHGMPGGPRRPEQIEHDFQESFGMVTKPDPKQRPTNVLAVPAPCKTAKEFDAKFLRKLVREVVIVRGLNGDVEPPLPDDVIVAGSLQDIAFTEAGIEHQTVTAESLIADGYQNDFLHPENLPKTLDASLTEEPEVEALTPAAQERLAEVSKTMSPTQKAVMEKFMAARPLPVDTAKVPETPVQVFGRDDDPDDSGGSPTPVVQLTRAAVDNQVADILARFARNERISPQERQIMNRHNAGDTNGVAALLRAMRPYQDADARAEKVGAGHVANPGSRVV
jgi:hypothetical protein